MEYGLIGEHLPHSFSKIIHEKLAPYQYDMLELAPDEIDAFMRKKDFKGINVTIPYKEKVIPYLDEISDQARRIGAVNTIVNRDGSIRELLRLNGTDPAGRKVLILGSGGTSKTARAVAEDQGAERILRVLKYRV